MSFLAKIYKQRLRMTDALYGRVGGDRVSPDIRGVVAESDWQVRGHLPLPPVCQACQGGKSGH